MRTSRRTPPSSTMPRTSTRARAIPDVLAFLTFAGAVLATYESTPSRPGLAPMTLAALLVVIVGGVRLQRAHRARTKTRKALAWIEKIQVSAAPAIVAEASEHEHEHEHADTAVAEQPEVRALRMQVRTLETALEEQQVLGRVQSVHDMEHELAQARAEESQRILLTIQAMREVTATDPGAEHVLNRIEAALTRLGAPSAVGRPVLPAPVASAAPVASVVSAETFAQTEPNEAPTLTLAVDKEPVKPIDDTMVLPVPAPEPPADRGNGRQFRRNGDRVRLQGVR